MSYSVYVIKNRLGTKYTGQTSDLVKRLQYHNSNRTDWTRTRGPWQLIYKEDFVTRKEAMRREKYLKTGVGRDFLKRILGA